MKGQRGKNWHQVKANNFHNVTEYDLILRIHAIHIDMGHSLTIYFLPAAKKPKESMTMFVVHAAATPLVDMGRLRAEKGQQSKE